MTADGIVLMLCLIAAAFVIGIDAGQRSERAQLATHCVRMQDERELMTTMQNESGVTCTYSINGYGKSMRKRKAT